jgi:hypothetical protein
MPMAIENLPVKASEANMHNQKPWTSTHGHQQVYKPTFHKLLASHEQNNKFLVELTKSQAWHT